MQSFLFNTKERLEHADPNNFATWLDNALVGDVTTYAIGEFGRAVELGRKSKGIEAIKALHEFVWNVSLAGKICLTQRRFGEECFEYLATKIEEKKRRRNGHPQIAPKRIRDWVPKQKIRYRQERATISQVST